MPRARNFKIITAQILASEASSTQVPLHIPEQQKPIAWGNLKRTSAGSNTAPPNAGNVDLISLKSLTSRFPSIREDVISDVLRCHLGNLEEATKSLTFISGEEKPQPAVDAAPKFMHPDPKSQADSSKPPCPETSDVILGTSSFNAESNWNVVKARKKMTPPKRIAADEAPEQTKEPAATLRLRAQNLKDKTSLLCSTIASLHDKGQFGQVGPLLPLVTERLEQYARAKERAEEATFAENNVGMERALAIDLHFLSRRQAEARLAAHLPGLAAAARGRRERWVRIVTGAGTHSPGGRAVLEPAVLAWLEARGIPARADAAGVIKAEASAVAAARRSPSPASGGERAS